MIEDINFKELKNPKFYKKNKLLLYVGGFFVIFTLYLFFLSAPFHFPVGHIVKVQDGSSLDDIALDLKKNEVIKHPWLFKTLAYLSGNQKSLVAGSYFFERKSGLVSVLGRISAGNYGLDPTFVTLPEGATIREMSQILSSTFEDFDGEEFIKLAEDKEGFLFPDTYSFLPSVRPEEVVSIMRINFNKKTEDLLVEIKESGYTLEEIITMASILEEEARTQESRETIAGILWKRIEIGMPLQVDAVFPYIIGKNTYELTYEDLDFDSPYNTYRYKGLPPGPITNPGLDSIKATLNPKESQYLFYLSDMSGNMHYAVDFETHKRNKALYIN
jgi:UPF0755 protein